MTCTLRFHVLLAVFAVVGAALVGCEVQTVEVPNWRVVPAGGSYRIEGTVVNHGEATQNVRLVFSTPSGTSRPDFALEHRGAEPPALELRIQGLRVGETRRFQLPARSASGYKLDRVETF